jgi:hypothetical protein
VRDFIILVHDLARFGRLILRFAERNERFCARCAIQNDVPGAPVQILTADGQQVFE